MRILVFNWKDIAHPAAGGAELYTHEVLRRWAARGDDVTLFASGVAGRAAREVVDGVTIVRRGGRYGVYAAARRSYRGIGREDFDVVIDEINTRPFMCPIWASRVPVVALIHQVAREIWFHELPTLPAWVGRYVLEPRWLRAYRNVPVLTVSESSRESLQEYGLRRIEVVPEGISLPEELPAVHREARPTIIFVGRLTANKRPDHAIAAYHHLRHSIPDAQMWVVGSGPMEENLRRLGGSGVTFFGRVSETEKLTLMARAHALMVTSVREGWGLVVDEAAAVGTPVFGYDIPGLRDSIPAAHGTLVEPDPTALARALAETRGLWTGAPASLERRGGAVDWDRVARAVREAITSSVTDFHAASV